MLRTEPRTSCVLPTDLHPLPLTHVSQLWATCCLSDSVIKNDQRVIWLTITVQRFPESQYWLRNALRCWWFIHCGPEAHIMVTFIDSHGFHGCGSLQWGKLFSVKVDKPAQGWGIPLIYQGQSFSKCWQVQWAAPLTPDGYQSIPQRGCFQSKRLKWAPGIHRAMHVAASGIYNQNKSFFLFLNLYPRWEHGSVPRKFAVFLPRDS